MTDYLSEAARITKPGGEIVINGASNNPYAKLPSQAELDRLGLEVKYQGALLPEFQGNDYRGTRGGSLPMDRMQTIILIKKR
jgi:filamentous hemagglutinin